MTGLSDLQREQDNGIRMGAVSEVDAARYRCRVESGEITTDWIPWIGGRVGATRDWSAPTVGEQVVLLCPSGNLLGAVALRGLYSDAIPPPSTDAAEHVQEYPDGAVIRYNHDTHALSATLPGGGTAEITADGGLTINGPVTVNGDSTFNGDTQTNGDAGVSKTLTASTDVIGGGKSLKGHRHTGVTTGSAVSGPPQ